MTPEEKEFAENYYKPIKILLIQNDMDEFIVNANLGYRVGPKGVYINLGGAQSSVGYLDLPATPEQIAEFNALKDLLEKNGYKVTLSTKEDKCLGAGNGACGYILKVA